MEKIGNFIENLLISSLISFIYFLVFVHLFKISLPVSTLFSALVFTLSWEFIFLNRKWESFLLSPEFTSQIERIFKFNILRKRINKINNRLAKLLIIISFLGIVNHIFHFFWLPWFIIFSYPLTISTLVLIIINKLTIEKIKNYFFNLSLSLMIVIAATLTPVSLYTAYLIGAASMYILCFYTCLKSGANTNEEYIKNKKAKLIIRNNEIAFSLLIIGLIGSVIHLINGLNYDWQIIFSYPLIIVAIIIFIPGSISGAKIVEAEDI
jgi:hypothetical protein